MKPVGEAMAIGRTFKQAFAKALRSRELDAPCTPPADDEALLSALENGGPDRFDLVLEAFRRGMTPETLNERTSIDPWFLHELRELALDPEGAEAGERTLKSVDTCAAEFASRTPYYYSARERPRRNGSIASEVERGERASVVILGAGPNRIGQGI